MANKLKQVMDKNLFIRTITVLGLVPIVLYSIYIDGLAFNLLMLVVAALMAYEWYKLTKKKPMWILAGLPYITIPFLSILYIRTKEHGLELTFWLFFTIWISDIAAFFSGRIIGGKKLAPKISPNKTWAGLIGALVASCAFGFISKHYVFHGNNIITLTIFIGLLAQAGDFFESWIKRKCGVKDSGKIIPGHGGILDRTDGIIFTAPKVAMILFLYPQYFGL